MELYQVTYIDKYKRPSIKPKKKPQLLDIWHTRLGHSASKIDSILGSRFNYVSSGEIPIDPRIKLNAQCKSYPNKIATELVLTYMLCIQSLQHSFSPSSISLRTPISSAASNPYRSHLFWTSQTVQTTKGLSLSYESYPSKRNAWHIQVSFGMEV